MHIRTPIVMPGAMPSASALLGTAAGSEILNEINSRIGATFIGTRYSEVDNAFMRNVVLPTRQAVANAQHIAAVLTNPDVIVPLDEIEKFKEIPTSMYLPIVLYAPVRALLERGRIEGFGIDPMLLPREDPDPYGRLISNCRVNDVLTAIQQDPESAIEFVGSWSSADPDLSFTDMENIEVTRSTIDRILALTEFDPTNIDAVRG